MVYPAAGILPNGYRYGFTDPLNALLNYGFALLEAETQIACLSIGLHPGLGIFHADKDGRASSVYDLMEPNRPIVDRLVLEFVQGHSFTSHECWETREGICRLDPHIDCENWRLVCGWRGRKQMNMLLVSLISP